MYDMGRKYMDNALDQNPEDNVWVVRAMILVCFYQPPTNWTMLWIYLGTFAAIIIFGMECLLKAVDTAIRRAQRYQLDADKNSLSEMPDKEYFVWRQLWLTIVSLDRLVIVLNRLCRANMLHRWAAIFLGRLPHIKESISRDHIFQVRFLEFHLLNSAGFKFW